jgi:Protein of unknown function (DUF3551)
MTKVRIPVAAAAAGLWLSVSPALAQTSGDAPWCAVVNRGAGEIVRECYYRSAEECAPTVIAGNRGFCTQNPYWRGPYPPTQPAPAKHRKRYVPPQ